MFKSVLTSEELHEFLNNWTQLLPEGKLSKTFKVRYSEQGPEITGSDGLYLGYFMSNYAPQGNVYIPSILFVPALDNGNLDDWYPGAISIQPAKESQSFNPTKESFVQAINTAYNYILGRISFRKPISI